MFYLKYWGCFPHVLNSLSHYFNGAIMFNLIMFHNVFMER